MKDDTHNRLATCSSCGSQFRATPKRTFLGFLKFKCPSCASDVLHPLTGGYRVTYWIILLLMVWAFTYNLSNGQISVPGLLGIGIIIALVEDARLRRRARNSQTLKTSALENQGLQAPAQDKTAANVAERVPSRSTNRSGSRVLFYAIGILAFLGAQYGVKAATKWYREATYKGDTPFERSFFRSLRGIDGYKQYLSVFRSLPEADVKDSSASMTRRGLTLLVPGDQARRIELLDHLLASASPSDCAAIVKGSPSGEAALTRLLGGMDSVSLDAFTSIVARAFIASVQSPGYRNPPASEDETVTFLRNTSASLPEQESSRFLATLANIDTASDPDVCWATHVMYRFALSQEAGARASAVRLVTLLEAAQGSSQ